MRVAELIAELQKLPQDALVGASHSNLHGWISVGTGVGTAQTREGLVVTVDCNSDQNFINPIDFDAETDVKVVYNSKEMV